MNNNNREPPHLLTSLAVTRPRPHRSRKPSSPSTLSPSLSCSYGTRTSLFEDDYLAAFFPALSAAGTALAPDPSHATSTSTCENNGNSTDRCTLAVEEKINSDQCRTPSLASVEEAGGGERMEEVEGKEEKEKEENGVGADEEGKEDCVNASRSLEDDGDDGPFSGDETCGTATNGKKLRTKDRCNSPISPSSPCSPLCPHSPPPPLNPASPSNATSPRCTPSPRSPSMASSLPLSPSSATKRRPSSSSSSSSISSAYPLSPSSVSQRRPSSSSSSSSSTYDAGLPLASPALKTSEEDHLSIFVFPPKISRLGSIYSHLGLSCSDTDFPGAEGDECSLGSLQRDIPPCKECKSPRRREGKIYASGSSHEGIPPGDAFPHKEVDEQQTDCGESGWDGAGASEGRGVPQHSSYSASTSLRPQRVSGAEGEWEQERKETRQAHSRPDVTHAAEGAVENETSVKIENQMYWKGSEAEEETDGNLMNKITEPSPSRPTEDIGKEEEGVKAKSKAPPAKPPRLGVKIRRRNGEDETRSSEDPVQYRTTDERQDLRMKKSASMDNILESNLQVSPKVKGSRLSESPAREVAVGILEAPLPEAWKGKKDKRTRHSVRREAKVVMAKLMAKKPPAAPHLERQKASRIMAESKKRAVLRDPQSSSLPPSPSSLSAAATATTATTTTTRHQEKCRDAYQPPNKPPRKNLQDTLGSGSIERTQATCSSHGAALNFYCVKCRVVVCRDCTVVAHSQTLNHKVLDTLDALATLRSEAVALLRHYTILSTMHTTLTDIYSKFKAQRPEMDTAAMCQRLEEGRYLAEVVKKAEEVVTNWTNIYEIKQRVEQWEARQQEWGDLVFLASRCALLADMHVPSDTVFLRMGSWVMPTPWIQLSHLLQPYLGTGTASNTSSSSTTSTSLSSSSSPSAKHLTSNTHRRGTDTPSPQVKRSVSPFGVTSSTGGTDQPFPYNARQVVLSNLVPYIILNPDVRYFVHIGGPRDVDLTLVVVPVEEHAEDYLKRRRNNATKTPALLRQSHYRPPVDAITMVEQQMTSGTAKTRITASSMSLGSAAALTIVKVSFSDVKVVSDGHGLPVAKGELRRGDVIIDQNASGKTMLTVAIRDIGDFPALRLGRVIHGMDGLICLVSTEDSRRAESSGLRAKIKATVKREEEAVYDVVFGMDL